MVHECLPLTCHRLTSKWTREEDVCGGVSLYCSLCSDFHVVVELLLLGVGIVFKDLVHNESLVLPVDVANAVLGTRMENPDL